MNMITVKAEKQCTRCHVVQPLSNFYREQPEKSVDGRRTWCKQCFKDYAKERYDSMKHEEHVAGAKHTLQFDFGETLQAYVEAHADDDAFNAVRPDMVEKPPHYNQGGIECIDYIKQQLGDGFVSYCEGNVIKYMHRYRHKNGLEDLKKAQWYLARMAEVL